LKEGEKERLWHLHHYFDLLQTGNHELYKASVIDYIRRAGGFLDWWGDRHLASNVVMSDTREGLSNKYIVLEGRHSTVLVFGFLYDLPDPADVVTVEKAEEAVQQSWFQSALQDEVYDAILVMAHMGMDDPSVMVIRNAIRKYNDDDHMPIQFVAGHTHLRRYGVVDNWSTSFEAGRYLDTIGFVSFPNSRTASRLDAATNNSTDLFQHVFMDASKETLRDILAADKLETPNGRELSSFIQKTQQRLELNQELGCAPHDYFLNRSLYDTDSLWGLYKDEVVPTQLEKDSGTTKRAIMVHQGSWRYDLLVEPRLVYDDIVAVSPFDEPVYFLGVVPGSIVLLMNKTLNANATPFLPKLPQYILAGTVNDDDSQVELYCHHFELSIILEELDKVYPGFKPDVITTNLTSTNIWEAFVLEQWPCPGDKGIHVPWFNNNNNDDDSSFDHSSQQSAVAPVITALFTILFVCGGLYILSVTIRQFCFCCGHGTVGAEEFEPVKKESTADEDEGAAVDDDDDWNINDYEDEDEAEFSEFR
jgi:hypothetical protein